MKKKPIARKVMLHLSIMLAVALAILLVGAFLFVSNNVHRETEKYAQAIVGVYGDLAVYNAEREGVPINSESSEILQFYSEYICRWYNIDYAYIYQPDVENGTVSYIALARDSEKYDPLDTGYIGTKMQYTLKKEEAEVLSGKRYIAHIITSNEVGLEISSIIRIEDTYGNVALVGIDTPYSDVYRQIIRSFSLVALIMLIVVVSIYFAGYIIINRLVSKPARKLSAAMTEFITGGERSKLQLNDNGTREYSMMISAFNSMTDDIDNYLSDISDLTRDQEHQQAELDIAADIQRGFLPKEHLILPDFELRGVMTPAKDVGGDFYDYVPLGDGKALTVIADVSGKGISAAMFMAVVMVLVRQYAKMELSPGKILGSVNDILTENNPQLLFATAFVGIYDSKNKIFTYADAGHNLPYIVGKELRVLNKASGTPLGLFPGEKYNEASEKLETGETLFLYTDGVSEATDKNDSFLGNDRLESILKKFTAAHGENLISFVDESVSEFVGDAEQHDDITMLTLTVKESVRLSLDVDIKEFDKIKKEILSLDIPRQKQLDLCLIAEECFVNICSYGYENGVPEGEKISFTLSVSDRITMRFADRGIQFDPLENVQTPEDYDLDTQIGGLGKFIAFSVADKVNYKYEDGKNVLTVTEYIEEEKQ